MTELGPLVVSLVAPTLGDFAAALEGGAARHADVVEFRLDRVARAVVESPSALASLVRLADRPTVAALHGGEGFGSFDGDAAARREVLRAAARAGVDRVDVDERFAEDVGDLGVPRILSSHRSASSMGEVIALARRLDDLAVPGRDLVKIVPPARTAHEALALLRWLGARPAGSTIGFCTGEIASFTRLLAPAYGSVLVYAAPEPVPRVPLETAAPGQLRASHVRAVWPGRAPVRTTPIAAVCGRPIGHSASPVVHGAALRASGVDGVLVPIAPESIADVPVIRDAVPAWSGLSVTAPFKVDAMSVADMIAPDAAAIGAANTIAWGAAAWSGSDRLIASNTDAPAVRAALESAGAVLDGAGALVVGAGGAARAAVHALRDAGARVTVAARRIDAARALGPDRSIALDDRDELSALVPDVIVHTTPLGTDGEGDVPIPDEHLRPGVFVLDAVYRPRRTALLLRAAERGAVPVEGSAWFLHQAWLQHLQIFARPYRDAFGPQGPPPESRARAMAAMSEALEGWLAGSFDLSPDGGQPS